MEEEQEIKEEVTVIGIEDIKIPECCREGWPNCPHVVKRQRKERGNVGM